MIQPIKRLHGSGHKDCWITSMLFTQAHRIDSQDFDRIMEVEIIFSHWIPKSQSNVSLEFLEGFYFFRGKLYPRKNQVLIVCLWNYFETLVSNTPEVRYSLGYLDRILSFATNQFLLAFWDISCPLNLLIKSIFLSLNLVYTTFPAFL